MGSQQGPWGFGREARRKAAEAVQAAKDAGERTAAKGNQSGQESQ